MMTFKLFAGKLETIPASTSWYLADLGEAQLFCILVQDISWGLAAKKAYL
jgi:hypothetical protein